MLLYESEVKELMGEYKIKIPEGGVAGNAEEAGQIARGLKGPVVIKADVLAKGRKEAGGIAFADSPADAKYEAKEMLEREINGEGVRRVLVEERVGKERELYFGITLYRPGRCLVALASSEGGAHIEDISSERIIKKYINPLEGFHGYIAREIAMELGYTGKQIPDLGTIFYEFYRMATDYNVGQVAELNPIIETPHGEFVVAHARLDIDDDTLYKHPELKPLIAERLEMLSPQERVAQEAGLSYVKLEGGNIGVISNGAGLTMATLDMIDIYKGEPSNFLDIGGGASADRMAKALGVVLSNPVEVVLINIFGGVTRCDEVARGILEARERVDIETPLVVRLAGTNEEEGRRILTGACIYVTESMEEGVEEAIKITKHRH